MLEYAYNYYEKHKVGPLYQNIKKHTGATRADIERLFPYGLNSVYTWVGIPIHSADSLCKPLATVSVEDFREVYLDHNATTPVRKEVAQTLIAHYADPASFGNPSSSTNLGKRAYDAIYGARVEIADCLGVRPEEIIFTGCGSEANNMAIKGIAFQHIDQKGHIISSNVEHPAVLRTLDFLQEIGFRVTLLKVNQEGRISSSSVQDSLREDTILVTIMAANNEIGAINPIGEIGAICRVAGIPLMTDAIQAFGKTALSPKEMGISLLSISGHKIYAPKGVGALYVDEEITLTKLIHGGGQEFGRRAGTENVASIVALGQAAKLIHAEMAQENERLLGLRDFFLTELCKIAPGFVINGPLENRLANNLNIGFPNVDSGSLLLSLNQIGVYVSAGSACSAGSKDVSHVIKALGVDTDHYGTIRFSFGLRTTREDLEYFIKYLPAILEQLSG
ncbi:MAG: cysteine desulfurase [Chloroflexi bacterium]|nr:cysteine desulfurase [Chloroflexota bacterium]